MLQINASSSSHPPLLLPFSPFSKPRRTSATGSSSCKSGRQTPTAFLLAFPGLNSCHAFPVCGGLKIISRCRSSEAASVKKRSYMGRAVVVSEVQDTVTAAGDVTDANFSKLVLECDIPVLVDFWAPWCGPCRMIAPLVDELARQYAGKLRCLKLNTDDSPKTANTYGVRSIPTVIIFKNGEKLDTIIGAVPKTTLTLAIEKYLS